MFVKSTEYKLLESAVEAGLIVSGLMQSDGDGDRSRLVTELSPNERPVQCPAISVRCVPLPMLAECPLI